MLLESSSRMRAKNFLIPLTCLSLASQAYAVDEWWERVTASPSRDIHLDEARIHLNRGRFPQAIAALQRTLHEHPNNLEIAYTLANLHYRMREYPKAISILRAYLDRASTERNLYYALALCYHKTGKLKNALGMYSRALQIDPTNRKAYVRLAQIRILQGLPFDARKVLKRVLEIDPEYLPALEELRIVERQIKNDSQNVYRKRNLVVFFQDHKQFNMIDRAFPELDSFRRKIESDFKYHIPALCLKLENKVRRFKNPPALYDAPEDSIRVEAATFETGNYEPVKHEIAMAYLLKMTKGNIPHWLAEGLALLCIKPEFLEHVVLRTTCPWPVKLPRRKWIEREFLPFETQDVQMHKALGRAYLVARYLTETYGNVGLRKLLHTFRDGEKDFFRAAKKALHLNRDVLERKLAIYGIRGHYFNPVTDRQHP